MEKDLTISGLSHDVAHRAAADRARWRTLAVASRARRCREDERVSELLRHRLFILVFLTYPDVMLRYLLFYVIQGDISYMHSFVFLDNLIIDIHIL